MSGEPILLAVDGFEIGGTQRQTIEILRGLRQSGRYRVVLSVLDRGGPLEPLALAEAAALLPLRRRARFDVTPALAMLRQARRERIRLILAIGRLSALAGLWVARRLGMPIVNGGIRHQAPLSWRDQLTHWCAVRSDWIVANSRAGLIAHGLGDHPRAEVIANGIDLARFTPGRGCADGAATICMVATFSSRKDHRTLIRALPLVRRAVPDARLVLVGTDAGTLAGSRRLVDELGLGDAVRFVTDTHRPEPLIAASRVCVLSSVSESFSNAILEYLALARPVVATDTCGDSAALVRDAGCGHLVPYGAAEPLAARLIELLRDPAGAEAMGAAGRRAVEAFTVERMASAYDALFDRLLTDR